MAYYFYELVEKLVDDVVYMSSYRCAKLERHHHNSRN